jgi:hypothetical protein
VSTDIPCGLYCDEDGICAYCEKTKADHSIWALRFDGLLAKEVELPKSALDPSAQGAIAEGAAAIDALLWSMEALISLGEAHSRATLNQIIASRPHAAATLASLQPRVSKLLGEMFAAGATEFRS